MFNFERDFFIKTMDSKRKQRGFFDLGPGLGLMLVFGGVAATLDSKTIEQKNLAKPETEIAQTQVVIVKSE